VISANGSNGISPKNKTATASFGRGPSQSFSPQSYGSEQLASPSASLAALLAALPMPAALLSAVAMRLLALSTATATSLSAHLAAAAHVIVILDHIRTTLGNRLVSDRFHKKLLSLRLGPHWRTMLPETVSAKRQSMAKHVFHYRSWKAD
jgi:hypothetical protein